MLSQKSKVIGQKWGALPFPPASAKAKGLGSVASLCLLLLASCGPGKADKGHNADSDSEVQLAWAEIVEESDPLVDSGYEAEAYDAPAVQEESPSERYQETLARFSAASGHKILHKDGRRLWVSARDMDGKYRPMLYVYDSETDDLSYLSINKTYQDDDAMQVEDIEARGGIITVIMSEMRNSNGWIEGTFVWQYNCRTGAWTPLAEEVSGAEFVNGRKSVRINRTEILNPDAPTYEQQYRPRYTTLPL